MDDWQATLFTLIASFALGSLGIFMWVAIFAGIFGEHPCPCGG